MEEEIIIIESEEEQEIITIEEDIEYVEPTTQEKTIVPTEEQQIVVPDDGVFALSKVTVEAIPNEYVEEYVEKVVSNINNELSKLTEVDEEKVTTEEYISGLKRDKTNLANNLVEKGIDATEDETFTSLVPKVLNLRPAEDTPLFTGSYDKEGLKQIGWTDEEIQYYNKYGVQWNESENYAFKLTETELKGDNSRTTRFIPKNSTLRNFEYYSRLLAIPQLDTSKVTNMNYMFSDCSRLLAIPQLDTSNVTTMYMAFAACRHLLTIPKLDTSKVTDMRGMFSNCSDLLAIPQLDTSSVTAMSSMFASCDRLLTIPKLDTSKVTSMSDMFYNCVDLLAIPQLDTSNLNYLNILMFYQCMSLMYLGGFKNLGKAYTQTTANYSQYTLNLSPCSQLTHDSLMNVINNLYDLNLTYDVANGGTLYQQKLDIGSTNLAKLTDEEIQIAIDKGWNVV